MLDRHVSHKTDAFQHACYYKNIHLLYLPAHASHVLQPLDVGVFSSLKQAYQTVGRELRTSPSGIGNPSYELPEDLQRCDEAALPLSHTKLLVRGGT